MGVVTATLPARAPGLRFLALAGAAPVALGLSRLLATYGLGFRLPAFGRGHVRTPCAWRLPPAHARLAEHPLQRRVDMNRSVSLQRVYQDRHYALYRVGA